MKQQSLADMFKAKANKAAGTPTQSTPSESSPAPVVRVSSDAADAKSPQQTSAPKRQREEVEVRPLNEKAPAVHDIVEFSALGPTAPVTAVTMADLFLQEKSLCLTPEKWSAAPEGQKDITPYAYFADILADISATGGRLGTTRHLANCYRTVLARSPQDLLFVVYLTINQVAPSHHGLELGIGDAILTKAVAESCGMTEKRVREEYQRTGDIAEVAQDNKGKQTALFKTTKRLTVASVFNAFKNIATMSGKDVQRRRVEAMKALIRDAQGAEINFIVRALQGKMRIGVALSTVLAALGYCVALHNLGPSAYKLSPETLQKYLAAGAEGISRAYHQVPSFELVIGVVVEHGMKGILPDSTLLSLRPSLPVKPMLAHPTKGISQVLAQFEGKKFSCEYKYDGERAQVHFTDGKFYIYSRNSEDHTSKYPDVIAALPKCFDKEKVSSFIMDSEVVAVDSETGALKPFQSLQHRGRKNIKIEEVTIQVCLFAFDLLYFNGESLLEQSLRERREVLRSNFLTEGNNMLRFAVHQDSADVDEIQEFLNQSIVDGCEGLMIKTLDVDAKYTPFKRSHHWLKLKKDYVDGLGDTVDLVPIGAFHGKGKRTGNYGGFLLACYDPENDEYQSICKIGTGFTDVDLKTLTEALYPHVIDKPKSIYRYSDPVKPDVWFEERFVWEVKAADLSISPVHMAGVGIVDRNKGIALRFPRFLKQRDDKATIDATSSSQIASMYRAQATVAAQAGPVVDDDGDEEYE